VLFYHVIPAKAGFVKVLKKLDSRLRGNDVKVLLHWLRELESTALPLRGQGSGRFWKAWIPAFAGMTWRGL